MRTALASIAPIMSRLDAMERSFRFGASLKDLGRNYCAVTKMDPIFIESMMQHIRWRGKAEEKCTHFQLKVHALLSGNARTFD
jgi:hypothetical protein